MRVWADDFPAVALATFLGRRHVGLLRDGAMRIAAGTININVPLSFPNRGHLVADSHEPADRPGDAAAAVNRTIQARRHEGVEPEAATGVGQQEDGG